MAWPITPTMVEARTTVPLVAAATLASILSFCFLTSSCFSSWFREGGYGGRGRWIRGQGGMPRTTVYDRRYRDETFRFAGHRLCLSLQQKNSRDEKSSSTSSISTTNDDDAEKSINHKQQQPRQQQQPQTTMTRTRARATSTRKKTFLQLYHLVQGTVYYTYGKQVIVHRE